VWDRNDFLNAYDFIDGRFVTTPSAVSIEKRGMNGGPTVSANGSDIGSGIVWSATTQSKKSGGLAPGTLRAFRASNIREEIYNSDTNAERDALGHFTKFAPPVVANGKVYVPTQSNAVVVYGTLCSNDVSSLVQVQTGTGSAEPNDTDTQSITIKNTSSHAIGAPFYIVVDNLGSGETLVDAAGVTFCAVPAGSPFIRSTSAPLWLPPDASFTETFRLKLSPKTSAFKIRVLTGSTQL
jgi:hypothetical protein